MAAPQSQEVTSSISRFTYHVFLSFRGEDTRKNFTDHLYTALINAGIITFRDDDEIERGENIDAELQKAIRESKISLIVLSKNYATSRWCLEELVRILDRRKNHGQIVFPVFYNVKVDDVGSQTGSYAEAFSKQEEKGKGLAEGKLEWIEKIKGWRAALTEIAGLEGFVLENQDNGHESKFIQKIVKEVALKLKRTVLSVPVFTVDIESRISHINEWLQDGSRDVGLGLICGMAGVGKTTIANVLFNLNYDKFDGSCFLSNIQESSKESNGLVGLQTQFLSTVLTGRNEKIYSVDEGKTKIKDSIGCKRILLVLDNVDHADQLDAIFGMRDWYHPGSKVIITSRNEKLLKSHVTHEFYKIQELDDAKSLQLFSRYAFGRDHPAEDFIEYSNTAVRYCGGLPFAILALAESLCRRTKETWKNELEKLEDFPYYKIQNKLETCYDSLYDDHEKDLFLLISASFVGKDREYVVKVLEENDFFPGVELQNLTDRSLVSFDMDNKLQMHQLIQRTGMEIIRKKLRDDPENTRRLLQYREPYDFLAQRVGSETTQYEKEKSLSLDIVDIERTTRSYTQNSGDESILRYVGTSLKNRLHGILRFH